MAKKSSTHFEQGRTVPNIPLIIETFKAEWFLPEGINSKDWEEYTQEIIDHLRTSLNDVNTTPRKSITLSLKLAHLPEIENEYIERRYGEWLAHLSDEERQQVWDVIAKKIGLDRVIETILDDNLHLRIRGGMILRRSWMVKMEWIKELRDIERFLDSLMSGNKHDVMTYFKKIDWEEAGDSFNQTIKSGKDWTWIQFSIFAQELIKSFIGRIDIYRKKSEKNWLVRQFEDRRDKKMLAWWIYLVVSGVLFISLLGINWALFLEYKKAGRLLSPNAFIESLFWQWLYLLSIELLIFGLAFYFLQQFRIYAKIVELYDSHMLLIESDFFYRQDEQFTSNEHPALFSMRKENTQRIHELPDKVSALFQNNTDKKSDSPWTAIEAVTTILKEVISKIKE